MQYHKYSFLLFEDREEINISFINDDTSTQKLNDLPKVTPGEQGLETIHSIYMTLLLKERYYS